MSSKANVLSHFFSWPPDQHCLRLDFWNLFKKYILNKKIHIHMCMHTHTHMYIFKGFLGGSVVENPSANAGEEDLIHPWVRKIPWRKGWLLTSLFLPGESHGQRNLVGYSPHPLGCKELDATEQLTQTKIYIKICIYVYIHIFIF